MCIGLDQSQTDYSTLNFPLWGERVIGSCLRTWMFIGLPPHPTSQLFFSAGSSVIRGDKRWLVTKDSFVNLPFKRFGNYLKQNAISKLASW